MNKNFDFATKLYNLRTKHGISQKELAEGLGVTNKAVSKWENAGAMPSLPQLIRLSDLLHVSIDELVKPTIKKAKKIYKIALTGGPCSGKSTALSWIQTEFTKKGYRVLFVPETATELILGGITPWTIDNNLNFESYILKLQLDKEKLFEDAAKHLYKADKCLIVCDRGALDTKAYMSKLEFDKCMQQLKTNEVALRDNYDAVFHLVTAAKGAEEFYTKENNEARIESKEEAITKDEATLNAWTGHPHLRVIDNSTNFKEKMRRLMAEISSFLDEDGPYEIERKFLIEYPDIKALEKMPNCKKVDIIQTYLKSNDDNQIRIRQRGENGYFTYTKTIKKTITNTKRLEVESRIPVSEYIKLLLQADTNKHQIIKTRYCLMHNNQYFEIDVYPFWKDKAILEIELTSEDQEINFPKDIKIIKEVTGNKNYYNHTLATTPSLHENKNA